MRALKITLLFMAALLWLGTQAALSELETSPAGDLAIATDGKTKIFRPVEQPPRPASIGISRPASR